MTRPVPDVAIRFIKGAEECVLRVYDDARPKYILLPGDKPLGRLTAGWGHTGPDLVIGMPVTINMCEVWLAADLAVAADRLAAKVHPDRIAALTDDEYAALLSFVFNLGTPGTTIWAVTNNGQFDQVPVQMMRFDQARDAKGQLHVVDGLIHRRMAEATLWKTPDANTLPALSTLQPSQQDPSLMDPPAPQPASVTSDVIAAPLAVLAAAPVPPPPSSVTRNIETPPAPAPQKPLSKSKSFIAQVTTAVLGVGAAAAPVISQIHDGAKSVEGALKPYVGQSISYVDKFDHVLIGVLAVTAVGAVLLTLRKQAAMTNG